MVKELNLEKSPHSLSGNNVGKRNDKRNRGNASFKCDIYSHKVKTEKH